MKRITLILVAILLMPCLMPANGQGNDYPNHSITIIVPSSPGGGIDFVARTIAPPLGEALNQRVLVDNRAGGGGMIGADIVAKASPDGYTLLLPSGDFAATPFLQKKVPYQTPQDFSPITIIGETSLCLVSHAPSVKIKTLQELIAAAKKSPNNITYASAGVTTSGNLAMELLQSMAGIDLLHVPYKGAGAANTATISGEVSFLCTSIAAVLPHIESGVFRPIAVTGLKRDPALPDVPTVAEAGVPGYSVGLWFGLLAPAKTPKAVIEKIYTGVLEAFKDNNFKKQMKTRGLELGGMTPTDFSKRIESEMVRLEKVIKDAGIEPK